MAHSHAHSDDDPSGSEHPHDHDDNEQHHDHEHGGSHEGHDHADHEHHHAHEGHAQEGHDHVHTHMSPEQYAAALRAAKDEYMRDDPTSPFGKNRSTFTGLRYFPYNPDLALELTLERTEPGEPVEMSTSTGATQSHARAGVIHFEIDGLPVQLTVYGEDDDLFLPMRDATSGTDTYGAGRYVAPTARDDDMVFVDFNLLYNPYCAYNEQFSCPLPPVENWLKVPIRAGEKVYTVGADTE